MRCTASVLVVALVSLGAMAPVRADESVKGTARQIKNDVKDAGKKTGKAVKDVVCADAESDCNAKKVGRTAKKAAVGVKDLAVDVKNDLFGD